MPILSLNKIGEKSFFVFEQSTIEFLLAYSFQKMFIHGLLYLHGPTLRILKEIIVGQIFQF